MYREAKYLFHFEGTKLVPLSKWALMNILIFKLVKSGGNNCCFCCCSLDIDLNLQEAIFLKIQ